MNDKRTIQVTGKGRNKIRPDMTRITLSLEGIYSEYSETLRRSSEDTECLKDLLCKFGFDRSDLKTVSFQVRPKYEKIKEKNTYKERFVGYKFIHGMKVEFLSDNDRLGRILYALAHSELQPKFDLSYTVADQEAVKNELLEKAVTDARAKAMILTRASGVILKDIISIDYSWGTIDFECRPTRGMMFDCDFRGCVSGEESYRLDIEPDDIEASDTVTVIWEIEAA